MAEFLAAQRDVLVFLAAAGLVAMIIVMPLAAELGRHSKAERAPLELRASGRPTEEPAPPLETAS
jgi:hypothetical protein